MTSKTSPGHAPGAIHLEPLSPLRASSWVLGARLDLRGLADARLVELARSTYALGPHSRIAAFRYGALVFWGASEAEQAEWVDRLRPFVGSPLDTPERDELTIRVEPEAREGLDADGVLVLRDPSVERLQVVAHVLAKSTVLAFYEAKVSDAFGRVEARAQGPESRYGRRLGQELLAEIREAFAIRVQTVGRVEVTEKPEIVWDAPDLDRLYEILAVEFELRERDAALSRKLELISDGASTSLDLLQAKRSLRVEWYIVILIAVEIALIVWDLAR